MSIDRQAAAKIGAGAFFLLYLALQVAAQIPCLLADRACEAAWAMYAGRKGLNTYVIWADSSETSLEDLQREGRVRVLVKVDMTRFGARYLCEQLPEARAVRFTFRRKPVEVRRLQHAGPQQPVEQMIGDRG